MNQQSSFWRLQVASYPQNTIFIGRQGDASGSCFWNRKLSFPTRDDNVLSSTVHVKPWLQYPSFAKFLISIQAHLLVVKRMYGKYAYLHMHMYDRKILNKFFLQTAQNYETAITRSDLIVDGLVFLGSTNRQLSSLVWKFFSLPPHCRPHDQQVIYPFLVRGFILKKAVTSNRRCWMHVTQSKRFTFKR